MKIKYLGFLDNDFKELLSKGGVSFLFRIIGQAAGFVLSFVIANKFGADSLGDYVLANSYVKDNYIFGIGPKMFREICKEEKYISSSPKDLSVDGCENNPHNFNTELSMLAIFFKAPLVNPKEPLINTFFRQRYGLENFFRILLGLPVTDCINLDKRITPKIV